MLPQDTIPEEWRPVVGAEDRYSISNYGRLRREQTIGRHLRGHILNPGVSARGYRMVSLSTSSGRWSIAVHALVARAFIGPRPPQYHTNHVNGIKTDNRLSNLEYCTASQNKQHAHRLGLVHSACGDSNGARVHPEQLARGDAHYSRQHPERLARGEQHGIARLTADKVRLIRAWYAAGEWTQRALAHHFGVSLTTIKLILAYRAWRHVT